MDASLDTNVIMHLYKANLQDVMFNRFEKLKVYEFIRNQELKKHAKPEVLNLFDKDVESGQIELITDTYLKEYGPHYTLMRIEDSEIMPFAFYELLFPQFLEQRLTEAELLERFNKVCDLSGMTMNCTSKLKAFMRRFWGQTL